MTAFAQGSSAGHIATGRLILLCASPEASSGTAVHVRLLRHCSTGMGVRLISMCKEMNDLHSPWAVSWHAWMRFLPSGCMTKVIFSG